MLKTGSKSRSWGSCAQYSLRPTEGSGRLCRCVTVTHGVPRTGPSAELPAHSHVLCRVHLSVARWRLRARRSLVAAPAATCAAHSETLLKELVRGEDADALYFTQ